MSISNRIVAVGGGTGSIPLDTDTSLTANSDTRVATQKAVKAYADATLGASGVTATAAEVNNYLDVSGMDQTITASGAVTPGKRCVFLNHATVAIEATIADSSLWPGLFYIKAGLEPGAGQDHTCTITAGTWDGTHQIATFADIADALLVYFDTEGNGTIVVNTGSVALS